MPGGDSGAFPDDHSVRPLDVGTIFQDEAPTRRRRLPAEVTGGFRSETRTSRYRSPATLDIESLMVSDCVKCVWNVTDDSPIFFLLSLSLPSVSFSAVNHGSTDRKNHPEFPQRDGARFRRVSFWSRRSALLRSVTRSIGTRDRPRRIVPIARLLVSAQG